jgi:predicted anti-sigma-YlaC factor YlaD
MNCSSAQRMLSAERDGALPETERASLAVHVAGCASCQRFRSIIAATAEFQKAAADNIPAPDEERAWSDIRKAINNRKPARQRLAPSRWWVPAGAAAAILIGGIWFALPPREPGSETDVVHIEGAGVEFVEVPAAAASMVYVDDETGWVVVWAANEEAEKPVSK